MISVQNHQQQLSGNKKLRSFNILLAIAVALGVSSCFPKAAVLRAPTNQGAVNQGSSKQTEAQKKADRLKKEEELRLVEKEKAIKRTVSLLLPFQLTKINQTEIQDKDVLRSSLALDFYQGFQLGLQNIASKGEGFGLNVVDTRDLDAHVRTVATSSDVEESSLVVGPVYPMEIKAFGASFVNKNVLQINPLAATAASEFNLPNLVSITPPITAHASAISSKVGENVYDGDIVIIYNTTDSDSKQFLQNMLFEVRQKSPKAKIVVVSSLSQLNERLLNTGTNYIISGTADKTQLNALVSNLLKKYNEKFYSIKLFGHPLWHRFDFSLYPNFSDLSPVITTESNYKNWTNAARTFKESYHTKYGVYPSDQSYKGYDVATYFGSLINKYGAYNIKDKLESESFQGLFNSYKFKYDERTGFTNEAVSFEEYRSGGFQLQ